MKHGSFRKYFRSILVGILVAVLALVILGSEFFLFLTTSAEKASPEARNIRLREYPPASISYVIPSDGFMRKTDGLAQREFRLEADRDGYIFPSRIHERSDVTILFLGGSTTECFFVEEKNRFPYLVGRLLGKDGMKVNSFNSGVSGNHSMHSIDILLNKGLALRPDVAIMMHNINDLNLLLYEKSYWNTNPYRSLLVSSNISYQDSAWYHLRSAVRAVIPRVYTRFQAFKEGLRNENAVDEFAHVRGTKLVVDRQDILEKFRRSLLTFIAVSRSNETVPVLMTQASRLKKDPDRIILSNWTPEKDFGVTYEEYRDVYEAMNEQIRKVGASANVLVIDLAREVPQESAYMYDAVHFNDNGSQYVAGLIADRLKSVVLH